MTSEEFRIPPHDADAERAVLGSLAICDRDPLIFSPVLAMLSNNDFFQIDHQIIFTVLADLHASGTAIDAFTLRDELSRQDQLTEVGGMPYLGQILNTVPAASHAIAYAEIVKEKSRLQAMIAAGNWLLIKAYASNAPPAAEMIGEAVAQLSKTLASGMQATSRHVGHVMVDVVDQAERGSVPMVKTGIIKLDEIIGGIALGEMMVLAARPSMGKSLLAKQIAVQVAAAGTPVGIIALEESELKIGRNLLAGFGVDNHRMRTGHINPCEWPKIHDGAAQLSQLPLFIAERARRMEDIRAVVAGWVARNGVKLVIIDYIQRIRGAAGRSAYEATSAISLDVSDLAKTQGVALIAVAQLNRGVETRDNKRPSMADLRDSGQIEQDADGIVFVHREDYYHTGDAGYRPTGMVELIIGKWRDAVRGGTVKLRSNLPAQRFEDWFENSPTGQFDPEDLP